MDPCCNTVSPKSICKLKYGNESADIAYRYCCGSFFCSSSTADRSHAVIDLWLAVALPWLPGYWLRVFLNIARWPRSVQVGGAMYAGYRRLYNVDCLCGLNLIINVRGVRMPGRMQTGGANIHTRAASKQF